MEKGTRVRVGRPSGSAPAMALTALAAAAAHLSVSASVQSHLSGAAPWSPVVADAPPRMRAKSAAAAPLLTAADAEHPPRAARSPRLVAASTHSRGSGEWASVATKEDSGALHDAADHDGGGNEQGGNRVLREVEDRGVKREGARVGDDTATSAEGGWWREKKQHQSSPGASRSTPTRTSLTGARGGSRDGRPGRLGVLQE